MLQFDATEEDIKVFLDEAEELLQVMEENVLALEGGQGGAEALQEIFRAAHTLKGSSATLGHRKMAEVTHAMEGLLDRLRKGAVRPTPRVVDTLFACLDVLKTFKEEIASGEEAGIETEEVLARLALVEREAAVEAPAAPPGAPDAPGGPGPAPDPADAQYLRQAQARGLTPWWIEVTVSPDAPMPSVRYFQALLALGERGEVVRSWPTQDEIEQDRVGENLRVLYASAQSEADLRAALASVPELRVTSVRQVSLPPVAADDLAAVTLEEQDEEGEAEPVRPAGDGSPPAGSPGSLRIKGARTVRVDVEVLDNLMNLVGELVIDRTRLVQVLTTMEVQRGEDEHVRDLLGAVSHIGRVTADLQELIMRARMLPVQSLFRKFPRMVRDLAHAAGKEIQFIVRGEETELDRSVIEEIGDPLMHILRNAIDHGIEPPDERVRLGKPRAGTVILEARHEENHIIITVKDDGRGIDPARVRAAAVRKGLLSEEAARRLSDEEAVRLIFAPGFSTAEKVSEVSGRGVGLDVVHKNIEKLSGTVEIQSEVGRGTEFRIKLPLTLAIIRALLVEHAGTVYAIPLGAVTETVHLTPAEIQTVKGREVIVSRGTVVPLVRLERAFEVDLPAGEEPGELFAVIVNVFGRQVGIVVHGLVGEGDVVIKSLGQYIGEVPGISGATLLGDGSVAIILDVAGLISISSGLLARPRSA
ncbi:chemotaxis protein CheA [Caldinitratiruptor microaerophilus]|uniref:Chemotaxis protein CheA n=1 Tax=Caldinitratiruptor microaerophilus TaxID=671077 RepID=A0AA35CI19_9FIRM|nr:chemotaxis protein CheA [Caldinitratiruptor microaerophilus]BDG59414.1 chemotaxis protein CheA [Caldinitratiruptor microaerophilus]